MDDSARTSSSQAVSGGGAGAASASSASSAASAASASLASMSLSSASSASKEGEIKDPEELKIMDLQIQAQKEMDARLNKKGLPNGGQGKRESEKQPGEKAMMPKGTYGHRIILRSYFCIAYHV